MSGSEENHFTAGCALTSVLLSVAFVSAALLLSKSKSIENNAGKKTPKIEYKTSQVKVDTINFN